MSRLVSIESADIFSNNLNLCTSIKIKLLRNSILKADNFIAALDARDDYKNGYYKYNIIEEPTGNFHIYIYPVEDNDGLVFNIINDSIGSILSAYGYGDLDPQELSYLSYLENYGFLFTCCKISKGTYLINI